MKQSILGIFLTLSLANVGHSYDAARMDQVVQYYVTTNKFMGSVLVAKGDEILLNKGYGAANLEWNVPNDPSTKFRIASLTKQFTAAAILLLEEEGKLKVGDPVSTYMTDSPPAWKKVTIFNLLTHTSGIPNFSDFTDSEQMDPLITTPQKLVDRFRDKPLDFEPGAKWEYSNSNYVLLGYLIQRLSGETYPDYLNDKIFKPLGMADSGYDSSADLLTHRAAGYQPTWKGLKNAKWIEMSNRHSAGALYSTTGDLWKWQKGLFGRKVLAEASLKQMTTPFLNDYAFGLFIKTVEGRKLYSHSGGISGFNSYLGFYPDTQVTVVVLGNLNGASPDTIGGFLGTLACGGTVQLPSERTEVAVPSDVLQRYVGKYRLSDGWGFTVTRDGDQLFLQGAGQQRGPIYPESESKFFRKGADVEFEFIVDAQTVKGVILHQDGDFSGVRE